MRLPGLAGLIASAGLLIACTTPHQRPDEPEAWQPEPGSCVRSLSEVEAVPLPTSAERGRRISFRDSASCLASKPGREPVLLYRLQDLDVPAAVDVTLHVGRSTVLAARLELLDSDFRRIEVVPFDQFTQRGGSYTRRLFFNDSSKRAEYLLIRSDRDVYGSEMKRIRGTTVTAPIITPIAVGSFTNGVEFRKTLLFRDMGRFTLEVVRDGNESES